MGSPCNNQDTIHFESQIVGSVSNISENTRFQLQHHPIIPKKILPINNKMQNPPPYDDIHPNV
jgi:hypothetical protein